MKMEKLRANYEDLELYNAGFPNFPRVFSRDSIISAILMKNPVMLENQLLFSSKRQGRKINPLTGEEAGKIFHEFPGYTINGLSTEYNACDTTALFLIGHDYYLRLTRDRSLSEAQKENILMAVDYIKSHIKDGLFYEDPVLSGSERFALKVTYWKDSEIAKREGGMPNYPISYYLAHAINFSGIRSAARILDSSELYALSEAMRQNFPKFFNKETKSCYIAIDSLGPIEGISSDFVHSLFYLEPGDLAPEYIKIIEDSSNELETEIGYITLSPKTLDIPKDDYHARTVWPFEQAIINIGAKKFNLQKIEETSRRIMQFLDTDPEIFIFQDDEFKKAGCDPQLWTVAAKNYFNSSAEMLQVPPALAPAYVSASPQSENL